MLSAYKIFCFLHSHNRRGKRQENENVTIVYRKVQIVSNQSNVYHQRQLWIQAL